MTVQIRRKKALLWDHKSTGSTNRSPLVEKLTCRIFGSREQQRSLDGGGCEPKATPERNSLTIEDADILLIFFSPESVHLV